MIFCTPHRQYGHDFKSRAMNLRPSLYFDLDESAGPLVNRGHLGISFGATLTGTPTFQAAPLVENDGYAMTFSGSSNYAATVASASIGNAIGVHTIGCWVKWTSTTTTLAPLSLRNSAAGVNTSAPLIILCNQPTAGKITGWSFGNSVAVTSGSTYNDGNRHLIIIGLDSSGTVMSLWVDGAFIGSGAVGTRASANLAFGIGANIANTPLQFFPGTIDEAFYIPSIVFTDAMALALYNAGIR
jgi:hypothetical protein